MGISVTAAAKGEVTITKTHKGAGGFLVQTSTTLYTYSPYLSPSLQATARYVGQKPITAAHVLP